MKLAPTIAAAASLATCASAATTSPSLLIFSKTEGYRHESIPQGIELVTSIAEAKGWSVQASEDSSLFTAELGSSFTTLVFVSTTGNFLNATEAEAMEQFFLDGGSWLGIHAAGDFGDDMPDWYNTLVGGQFRSHPCETDDNCSAASKALFPPSGNIRPDIVTVQDGGLHPSTSGLPIYQDRTDEWYAYKTNVWGVDAYQVLLTINETYVDTIPAEEKPELEVMAPEHPISWMSEFGEGGARVFYTGMGHTVESYAEEYFVKHLTGALEWVTGEAN